MSRRNIIVGAILLCLLVCMGLYALGTNAPKTTTPQTAKVASEPTTGASSAPTVAPAAAKPTEAPKPTDPPKPTNTTAPTNTPKPPPATATPVLGASREAPIPKGQPVTTKSGWTVTLGEFAPDANQIVNAANQFNTKPEAGQKWVFVTASGKYGGTPESSSIGPGNFRLVGKKGTIYNTQFIVLPNALKQTEVFKGGEVGGRLPYLIAADDTDLRIIVNTAFGEGIYMAVE